MKNIGILGSTGSVGRQSLEVIRKHPDKFNIIFLSANQNVDLLIEQSKEFKPQYICIGDKDKSRKLKSSLGAINILIGEDGLIELCTNNDFQGQIMQISTGSLHSMILTYNNKVYATGLSNKFQTGFQGD